MAVNAALTTGSGILKVLTPESQKNLYESSLTEAIIVAMNRIQDNKHYFSDVVFGAGLGAAIGLGFSQVYLIENNQCSSSSSDLFTCTCTCMIFYIFSIFYS